MPVLYLIGCAAPPVRQIHTPIRLAQQRGWEVCLVLTPTAATWLDAEIPGLEKLTGHPVRSQYKLPDDPDALPDADAMIAAPVTLKGLGKWALGLPDTLALGLLTEAIGKKLPLVALPYINAAQAEHPALPGHLHTLRQAGVPVLLGPEGHVPHPPGHGNADAFPWPAALDRVNP